MRSCSLPGCDAPAKTRGLCQKHYLRLHRHGDPLTNKRGDPWTPAEDARLLEACGLGRAPYGGIKALAPRLERSEKALKRRLYLLRQRQAARIAPRDAIVPSSGAPRQGHVELNDSA